MTSALSADLKTAKQIGTPPTTEPSKLSFPLATGAKIYSGAMVATNAAGNAVPASADPTLRIWGRCERQVDQAVSDVYVDVRVGCFEYTTPTSGVDQITAADVGHQAYVINDNSVARDDGGGLRPKAGKIVGFDSATGCAMVYLGAPSNYDSGPLGSGAFQAVGMGPTSNVASLAAFTVAGNDGNTYAAGDVVVLYAQTSALANGPYVVGTVTTGTAALTRPDWWPAGAALTELKAIEVKKGTLFANTAWRSTNSTGVVDTDDPKIYPGRVTQSVTIASGGGIAVTNVPILSATKTGFMINRTATGGTVTSTVQNNAVSITPGAVGTATVTVQAQIAAGTANASDTSTFNLTIVNF